MRRRLLDRHAIAARCSSTTTAAEARGGGMVRQLARDNYVNAARGMKTTARACETRRRRELALEIIRSAKLDVERLGALTRLEREVE
jgi:hypothetical protein